MKKQLLWDLFVNTGKIEYYLKYKSLSKENYIYESNDNSKID